MTIALRLNALSDPAGSRIRVFIVHDDPLGRAGLSASLAGYADIEVVGAEAGRDLANAQPGRFGHRSADVIVAAYEHGIELAAEFAASASLPRGPKVMIVTSSDREWEIRNAIKGGVRGYLLAGCSLDELAHGVRAVHRGERHLCPQAAQRLAVSISTEPLTAREEEVLRLVVEGLCNKAIARQLDIAIGTVKTHLRSTFDKLGVESRTQAVVTVAERGLLCATGRSAGPGARGRGHAVRPSQPSRIPAPPANRVRLSA